MNAKDLAKSVAQSQGLTEAAAKKVVEAVAEAAAAGDEVNLPGFGKFKVKDMPERGGRNPSTGEAITIAASKKLTFTSAKALKDRL